MPLGSRVDKYVLGGVIGMSVIDAHLSRLPHLRTFVVETIDDTARNALLVQQLDRLRTGDKVRQRTCLEAEKLASIRVDQLTLSPRLLIRPRLFRRFRFPSFSHLFASQCSRPCAEPVTEPLVEFVLVSQQIRTRLTTHIAGCICWSETVPLYPRVPVREPLKLRMCFLRTIRFNI